MSCHTERKEGLLLALAASGVSGLAVFLNGYAVKHSHAGPIAYTTVKNMVTAAALVATSSGRIRHSRPQAAGHHSLGTWLGFGYVGLVGGGLAFALFFQGLATSSATTAAFVQKSLVVWVIALAVALLGEKVGPLQWTAVALVVVGAVALDAGKGGLRLGEGPILILTATVLWAVEVIVAKRLLVSIPSLTLGRIRMTAGTGSLFAWLAVTGRLGQFARLGSSGWIWALLTGAILTLYVGLWFGALARARAVDVTAVLVSAAFVTAVLSAGVQGARVPNAWGLIPLALGTAVAGMAWRSQPVHTRSGP